MIRLLAENPYRVLGVYSNAPLKERVANQNRLNAFAKVGKEISFPNDFTNVIAEKPPRTPQSILTASTSLTLDRDKLKHSLFWFIESSVTDGMALQYLQNGNIDKAKELLSKKETFSSLLNRGVIAFIENDFGSGFTLITKVIHNEEYRISLLQNLGIVNLDISESEIAELFINELLKEVYANQLLTAASNQSDRAIISKSALEEPLSKINSAIAIAKAADNKNPNTQLEAGTKLMNSTKTALKQVKDIVGATSPQYQMAADNLAKQILQCGINYYNNAPDEDIESPRKAMVLQEYALKIAVGKLTKDRCQENYDVLKKAVDNMPPAAVAIEARKIKDELRQFCQLPDKISHSISLLNNTKPLLQTIKNKLGSTNAFYLSLSTQVVGNALHNLIEEVNVAQNYLMRIVTLVKEKCIDPSILNMLNNEMSPKWVIDNKLKPVLREAWRATVLMDSFDLEQKFRTERYSPNRDSLKKLCDDLDVSTRTTSTFRSSTSTTRTTSSSTSTYRPSSTSSSSSSNNGLPWGCWVAITIIIISIIISILAEF